MFPGWELILAPVFQALVACRPGCSSPRNAAPRPGRESASVTELKHRAQIARFRLRPVAAAVRQSRSGYSPRGSPICGSPSTTILDPGREQPHRGRADHAQPRPDPRSQRRRPGQLLRLHPRDRAGKIQAASTRRSASWPRSSTSPREGSAGACSRAASSRCRSGRASATRDRPLHGAVHSAASRSSATVQLSARRSRQPLIGYIGGSTRPRSRWGRGP